MSYKRLAAWSDCDYTDYYPFLKVHPPEPLDDASPAQVRKRKAKRKEELEREIADLQARIAAAEAELAEWDEV